MNGDIYKTCLESDTQKHLEKLPRTESETQHSDDAPYHRRRNVLGVREKILPGNLASKLIW